MSNWRKATASNSQGACAEVGSWRTATASTNCGACAEVGEWRTAMASINNGACVQAGQGAAVIAVRDTKAADDPQRVTLEFGAVAWTELTRRIKRQAALAP
jgi:hypothetical protein